MGILNYRICQQKKKSHTIWINISVPLSYQLYKSENSQWGYMAVVLPVIWLPLCSKVLWFSWRRNPHLFLFLKRKETSEVLNIWISISEREGHSADCCLLGPEVYSPFLDLVTASWWEAGMCGRSPSVLWIYWGKEYFVRPTGICSCPEECPSYIHCTCRDFFCCFF